MLMGKMTKKYMHPACCTGTYAESPVHTSTYILRWHSECIPCRRRTELIVPNIFGIERKRRNQKSRMEPRGHAWKKAWGWCKIPNLEFSRCVRPGTHPDERVNNEVYSCLEQENSTIFLQRERLHLHVLILGYHIQRSTWCVKKGKGPPNLQNNSLKSHTAI